MLGDESTTGREEQQYSCDVEICGRNQECTPSCAKRTISAVSLNSFTKFIILQNYIN